MRVDSVPSVIDALERAPAIVVPLVREVPRTFLKRRPKSGKWSAHEHACHLGVVHALFFERLDHMLLNPAPVITPYDPGTHDPDDALLRRDLDESLDSYVRDRVRLVRRLREVLEVTEDAISLAEKLIAGGGLPTQARVDALQPPTICTPLELPKE